MNWSISCCTSSCGLPDIAVTVPSSEMVRPLTLRAFANEIFGPRTRICFLITSVSNFWYC